MRGIYIQLSAGNIQTDYQPYSNVFIKPTLINEQPVVATSNKRFKVIKSGVKTYIKASFNALFDIVVVLAINTATNSSLNIYSAKLIPIGSDIVGTAGFPLMGASADDACPVNVANGFKGGNHGESGALSVTSTAHGKTLADFGSVYTDGDGTNFTLMAVKDANTLIFISQNMSGTPESNWLFKATVTGNLTYVSNGSNTADITVSSYAGTQFYPITKNILLQLFADGQLITADGIYDCDNVSYIESYDIVDVPSMVAALTANRPVGGYTTTPDYTTAADIVISRKNTYVVQDKCATLLLWSIIFRKNITLSYFGGTQSGYLPPDWATTYKRYIANSLPISDGSKTWDFRIPQVTTPLWTATMNMTSPYWENGSPIFRTVDFADNGTDKRIAFNCGYVPFADEGVNRINNIANAVYLYTSGKNYQYAIDGTRLNVAGYVPSGTIKQGACFRGWCEFTDTRSNYFIIRNGNDVYVFLDWHSLPLADKITLPDDCFGKSIILFEKTPNVTITDSIVTGPLDINISTSTANYGYCVLKLN